MKRRSVGGFTLLELLVALSVFAMISVMAYTGLRNVLQTKQHTEQRAKRIQRLQSTMLMLERDLSQIATMRGVRNDFGDVEPALRTADFGAISLEFTRAGWRNPTGMARSTLQRVAYGIEEESLRRFSWTVLDRAQGSTSDQFVLLEGVREMRLRYLGSGGDWQEQWPPLGQEQTVPASSPRALEVTLQLDDLGEIRRLFPLLESASVASEPPPPPPQGDTQ